MHPWAPVTGVPQLCNAPSLSLPFSGRCSYGDSKLPAALVSVFPATQRALLPTSFLINHSPLLPLVEQSFSSGLHLSHLGSFKASQCLTTCNHHVRGCCFQADEVMRATAPASYQVLQMCQGPLILGGRNLDSRGHKKLIIAVILLQSG